jgi:hypothetical protein
MVFDETDCDCMERALARAYRLFMSNGRLCAENLSIAKATLSRAIMHAMDRGERNESRLAMYAINTFNSYSDDIVARDVSYLRGSNADSRDYRSDLQHARHAGYRGSGHR